MLLVVLLYVWCWGMIGIVVLFVMVVVSVVVGLWIGNGNWIGVVWLVVLVFCFWNFLYSDWVGSWDSGLIELVLWLIFGLMWLCCGWVLCDGLVLCLVNGNLVWWMCGCGLLFM